MSRESISEAYHPLLSNDDDINKTELTSKSRLPWGRALVIAAIALQSVLTLVLVFAGLSLYSNRYPGSLLFPQALYSPAEHLLEYRIQTFHPGFHTNRSIYQGPPSAELDAAWEDLYSFGVSRIPKNEAARMANLTVPIPGDEDHYVVELDVFHELHCLNMIRQTLNPDYYPPMHADEKNPLFSNVHIGHCVDSIRQSLMCSADISTIVYKWIDEYQMSLPLGDVVHTCRNFEKLQEWGRAHALKGEFDTTVYVENDLDIPVFY